MPTGTARKSSSRSPPAAVQHVQKQHMVASEFQWAADVNDELRQRQERSAEEEEFYRLPLLDVLQSNLLDRM